MASTHPSWPCLQGFLCASGTRVSYWDQGLIHRIACDFTRRMELFELRFFFLQFLRVMILNMSPAVIIVFYEGCSGSSVNVWDT